MSKFVIFRQSNEWRTITAQQIADGMSTDAAINPMSLVEFFGAIVQAGGDAEKLGELWNVAGGRFADRAETALSAGDLAAISGLVATIPAASKAAIGTETMTAIQTVIGANTISAGAKFWNEEDGEIPTFDATWVEATLTEAGYVWNGSAWVRVA